MVSLDLSDRTRFFRTYTNAFTTDDAAANLASLRFSQSNRTSDPNDPQRIVTTTTTTTFSMSREIAKGICQHFMDARLIENASDPSSSTFKDRGIYQITPKGLHILERFITKNGISADHLIPVFTSQPICMKLLHLERRQSDDDIHISRSVIEVVFRRFAGGRTPNYVVEPYDSRSPPTAKPFSETVRLPDGFDRANGVDVQDVVEKNRLGQAVVVKQVFSASAAVDWLLNYSTCCCREEAGELLAHMVRNGLIAFYAERARAGDRVTVVEVSGSNGQTAEFRYGPRVLYRITEEGRLVAQNALIESAATTGGKKAAEAKTRETTPMAVGTSSGNSVEDDSASSKDYDQAASERPFAAGGGSVLSSAEGSISGSRGMRELFKSNVAESSGPTTWAKDQHSTATRLRAILDEPAWRALFRDFLRANYCDENLAFWLDVNDFRRRFSTTSSAVGASSKRKQAANASAMEAHQQNLVAAALHIYNTYLAPLSPNELNIDHNLRADVVNYVNRSLAEVGAASPASATPASAAANFCASPNAVTSQTTSTTSSVEGSDPAIPPLRATQVQTLLRQYERIQEHIFRLLATDQVPRFIRCVHPFRRLRERWTDFRANHQDGTIPGSHRGRFFRSKTDDHRYCDQVGRAETPEG